MRDVLDCALVLLRAMPMATSLDLRVPGCPSRVVWTTSGKAASAAQAAGAAVWAPDEYEALALGVELERVSLADVVDWCRRKVDRGAPRVLIDARVVMAGAEGLVPYLERYDEVRAGRGRTQWVLAGKVARTAGVGGLSGGVLQRTTLTLGEVLARLGIELLDVEVHARAPKVKPAEGPAWAAI